LYNNIENINTFCGQNAHQFIVTSCGIRSNHFALGKDQLQSLGTELLYKWFLYYLTTLFKTADIEYGRMGFRKAYQ
jgi:hypothetical protein